MRKIVASAVFYAANGVAAATNILLAVAFICEVAAARKLDPLIKEYNENTGGDFLSPLIPSSVFLTGSLIGAIAAGRLLATYFSDITLPSKQELTILSWIHGCVTLIYLVGAAIFGKVEDDQVQPVVDLIDDGVSVEIESVVSGIFIGLQFAVGNAAACYFNYKISKQVEGDDGERAMETGLGKSVDHVGRGETELEDRAAVDDSSDGDRAENPIDTAVDLQVDNDEEDAFGNERF